MARANNAWTNVAPNYKLRDSKGSWIEAKLATSKKLREILFECNEVVKPKITIMDEDQILSFYNKISKLVSIPNKTKMCGMNDGISASC